MFELCCRGARRGERLLIQLINGGRVDVGGRRNGAHAAVPHIGEQKGFAADEYVESASRTGSWSRTGGSGGKRVEKSLGIIPIARAVFHPGDCIRIGRKEALDQSRGDPNPRDRRNVVGIIFQSRIPDALDNFAEIALETLSANILAIKRRKRQ